jgi:hypothetical protein
LPDMTKQAIQAVRKNEFYRALFGRKYSPWVLQQQI